MDMNKLNFKIKKGTLFFRLILIPLLFFSNTSFPQQGSIEYKIKAGYIYNFTKFISWPENESATFDLCILGTDPFGSILDSIEKRAVKNKPIRLYRFQSIDEAKHCQIVYFSDAILKWGELDSLLPGVLTIYSVNKTLEVSESKQFTQAGGMIAFFLRDGKVKLHINLQVLRKSGLEISAKLLEVAEVNEGGPDD